MNKVNKKRLTLKRELIRELKLITNAILEQAQGASPGSAEDTCTFGGACPTPK
jgi:hypothetical protein